MVDPDLKATCLRAAQDALSMAGPAAGQVFTMRTAEPHRYMDPGRLRLAEAALEAMQQSGKPMSAESLAYLVESRIISILGAAKPSS